MRYPYWRIRVERKKEDAWIGFFWRRLINTEGEHTSIDIWICIIPMLPIHIHGMAKPPNRLIECECRCHNSIGIMNHESEECKDCNRSGHKWIKDTRRILWNDGFHTR